MPLLSGATWEMAGWYWFDAPNAVDGDRGEGGEEEEEGERSRSEEVGNELAGLRVMREGGERRRGCGFKGSFVGESSPSFLLSVRAQSLSDPVSQLCSDST